MLRTTGTFSVERSALDVGRSAFGSAFTRVMARPAVASYHLRPVVSDRFDRTAFHRFFAKSFFFWRLGLLINVGMAAVVVSFEIGRRGFTAQIAIDALIIDIEFARYVFGVFVRGVGHGFSQKNEGNVRKKTLLVQSNLLLNAVRRNRRLPSTRLSR